MISGSIPGVAQVSVRHGREAPTGARPEVLLEVPHGATRAAHFDALASHLAGPFPDDLKAFFFVNTDVGAPEVALRLAERLTAHEPAWTVAVVRCLLPRTFVDTNRVIDPDAAPQASAAGEVTPGIISYVKDAGDLALLLDRYGAYRALVERAYAEVCGAGGLALMLHSYAPRSLDVPVDERIVERLRAEYAEDRIGTWPLRAEVDLITRTSEGTRLADEGLVSAVQAAFARVGVTCATDETYALHASTMGHRFASAYPGHTLCVEMRRDLLVRAFTPFAEMLADPAKVDRMAGALEEGIAQRPR